MCVSAAAGGGGSRRIEAGKGVRGGGGDGVDGGGSDKKQEAASAGKGRNALSSHLLFLFFRPAVSFYVSVAVVNLIRALLREMTATTANTAAATTTANYRSGGAGGDGHRDDCDENDNDENKADELEKNVAVFDLGEPLHSPVLFCRRSQMHEMELEMLEPYMFASCLLPGCKNVDHKDDALQVKQHKDDARKAALFYARIGGKGTTMAAPGGGGGSATTMAAPGGGRGGGRGSGTIMAAPSKGGGGGGSGTTKTVLGVGGGGDNRSNNLECMIEVFVSARDQCGWHRSEGHGHLVVLKQSR